MIIKGYKNLNRNIVEFRGTTIQVHDESLLHLNRNIVEFRVLTVWIIY